MNIFFVEFENENVHDMQKYFKKFLIFIENCQIRVFQLRLYCIKYFYITTRTNLILFIFYLFYLY